MTVTRTLWCPVAPPGNFERTCEVWTTPLRSMARTWNSQRPAVAGQSTTHWRQLLSESSSHRDPPIHPSSGDGDRAGSIPARAGEPSTRNPRGMGPPVYPRACGGTTIAIIHGHPVNRLSPRVRGNPPARASSAATTPSIPRVRGNRYGILAYAGKTTLSPRVRGNRADRAPRLQSGEGREGPTRDCIEMRPPVAGRIIGRVTFAGSCRRN